jgi:hypothetical protein
MAMGIRGMGILPMWFQIFTRETPMPLVVPVAFFRGCRYYKGRISAGSVHSVMA